METKYLYLLLNIFTLSIPLVYSIFEKKFHFIQYFKKVVISIVLVAIPFLVWDYFFTEHKFWGFNPDYLIGVYLLGMPIEEWLFFFCIPYACLFTAEVLHYYFKNFRFSKIVTKVFALLFLVIALYLLFHHFGKWYTTVNLMVFLLLFIFSLVYKFEAFQNYLPCYLIVLIPFLLVNGVLTGSWINEQVVWYNNMENSGIRVGTIPIEDFYYAFTLLFGIQLIFNRLKRSDGHI